MGSVTVEVIALRLCTERRIDEISACRVWCGVEGVVWCGVVCCELLLINKGPDAPQTDLICSSMVEISSLRLSLRLASALS